jgi:hypothetical protein
MIIIKIVIVLLIILTIGVLSIYIINKNTNIFSKILRLQGVVNTKMLNNLPKNIQEVNNPNSNKKIEVGVNDQKKENIPEINPYNFHIGLLSHPKKIANACINSNNTVENSQILYPINNINVNYGPKYHTCKECTQYLFTS